MASQARPQLIDDAREAVMDMLDSEFSGHVLTGPDRAKAEAAHAALGRTTMPAMAVRAAAAVVTRVVTDAGRLSPALLAEFGRDLAAECPTVSEQARREVWELVARAVGGQSVHIEPGLFRLDSYIAVAAACVELAARRSANPAPWAMVDVACDSVRSQLVAVPAPAPGTTR